MQLMKDELKKKNEIMQDRWDRVYRENLLEELPWEEQKPSSELVALIESGVVENGSVLDICCGSANNAVYLARLGYTCYGIDISAVAIKYARAKVRKEGVACNLTTGNVIKLPYADNMFTLVFDRGCFHSLPPDERDTFIRGVYRVLKTGGKYQLICFSSRDHRSISTPYSFSTKDIESYFTPFFKILHIKELSSEKKEIAHYFLSALMEKTG